MKALNYAALVLTFGIGTAVAGDYQKQGGMESGQAQQQTFSTLDANQDGYINPGEASASTQLKSSFGKLDADKDGRLSSEEFSDYKPEKRSW